MQRKMTKTKTKFILFFLINIFFICLIISVRSKADDLKIQDDLIVLGADEAPVKIKVFSSLTCPHCANFHIKVVPQIKEKYIQAGKVQLIFIDFPLDQSAFNASKLLHCLDKTKRIVFLDKIYENQSQWTSGSNINEINNNLRDMVKNFGINSDKFDKCLNNEVIEDKILNARIDAHKKYFIESTPTIIINEKKLNSSASFKNIEKKIKNLI